MSYSAKSKESVIEFPGPPKGRSSAGSVFLLIKTMVVGAAAIWTLWSGVAGFISGDKRAVWLLAFFAICFIGAPVALAFFRASRRISHDGPSVTLNDEGIGLHLYESGLLPWRALCRVEFWQIGPRRIELRFDPDLLPSITSQSSRLPLDYWALAAGNVVMTIRSGDAKAYLHDIEAAIEKKWRQAAKRHDPNMDVVRLWRPTGGGPLVLKKRS